MVSDIMVWMNPLQSISYFVKGSSTPTTLWFKAGLYAFAAFFYEAQVVAISSNRSIIGRCCVHNLSHLPHLIHSAA